MAAGSGSAGAELQLDCGPAPEMGQSDQARLETRGHYQKTLARYARDLNELATAQKIEWSVCAGTLKRWVGLGRKAADGPDLPPFDELPLMADWWERHMTWRVPEIFERLRAGGGGAQAAIEDPEAAEKAAGNLAAARKKLPGVERGFAAALERCEEAEALAYVRWQEELNRPAEEFDPAAERDRRKVHDESLTKLRQMRSGAAKILGDSEEFARLYDVEVRVAQREANLKAGVLSLMTRISAKVQLPPELFKKLSEAYEHELDGLFATMLDSDFAEPLALEHG